MDELKDLVAQYPVVRRIVEEHQLMHRPMVELRKKFFFVPPGHFYSPIPSPDEIAKNAQRIFADPPREIPGINLNTSVQLEYLEAIAGFYDEHPFPENKTEGIRYYLKNDSFSFADGYILYGMIRHLKPRRLIEVGSGFSSCVTLDTNERFFNNTIDTTFIEPFPELFYKLMKKGDRENVEVIASKLQDVPLDTFSALGENDILFIDSTHVAKVDSDVNYLFAKILPSLNVGVYIHIHDIFYPFEYPRPWIEECRAWNELYMLRSFLQYNQQFEIVLFSHFLNTFYRDKLGEAIPLALINPGGNIWLRKTG